MNERVKRLTEEIRKLSPEEQADLMDELLVALHDQPDPEIEKAWVEEAERRLAAVERGELATYPLDQVMAELRSRFPRRS
jgi:putative addiction module component (TIGR02574 family)